mgnify:FL=1
MSDTPNLQKISINSRGLESLTSESINNLFDEVFDINVSLPDWASAPAEGNFFPSAQLCTRDGRVTGNAVLMWWTIVSGMPAAVVATDAGNVIIVSQDELEEQFYAPEFLMREPLYAHLAGVAAAGIDIPDEYEFLFALGGVPLEDEDDFIIEGVIDDFDEGPNPIVMAMMEAILSNLMDEEGTEPEIVEDQLFIPSDDVDVGNSESFGVVITDGDGDTMSASFDTVEELNEFLQQMGVPFQV